VTVGEAKAEKIASAGAAAGEGGRLGLAVRPLDPDEKQEAALTSGGLVVENASGPAARAGIQPGDIVLALNGTPVRSVDELKSLVGHSGKTVALLIQRDKTKLFVPVVIG
jgi:serine protease Do